MRKFNETLETLSLDKINLITFLIGLFTTIIGVPSSGNIQTILISIGTSLVASSIIAFLSARYLVRKSKIKDIMERWGLEGIYETRAEMNESSNRCLFSIDNEMDIIALGMRSFRDAKGSLIKDKVKKGINLRILTLNPESEFVKQREKDENRVQDEIKKTIYDLISWANKLKSIAPNESNVQIKFYNTYPLDSYLRIDNHIYIGPNMYKKVSQQTISYEFKGNSLGYSYYSSYFNELWFDSSFCKGDFGT